MINPDQQEKHLAPLDIKIKQKTAFTTMIAAIGIVIAVFVIAEVIARIIIVLKK